MKTPDLIARLEAAADGGLKLDDATTSVLVGASSPRKEVIRKNLVATSVDEHLIIFDEPFIATKVSLLTVVVGSDGGTVAGDWIGRRVHLRQHPERSQPAAADEAEGKAAASCRHLPADCHSSSYSETSRRSADDFT